MRLASLFKQIIGAAFSPGREYGRSQWQKGAPSGSGGELIDCAMTCGYLAPFISLTHSSRAHSCCTRPAISAAFDAA
jgi:hypothetical protein